jgi:RES domain-containing protein
VRGSAPRPRRQRAVWARIRIPASEPQTLNPKTLTLNPNTKSSSGEALPSKSGSFQKQHFLIHNIKSMVVPPSYHISHAFEALHPKPQTLNPKTLTLNPNPKSSSGEALPSKSGPFQKQHFLINNNKCMVILLNYNIFNTFEALHPKPQTLNPNTLTLNPNTKSSSGEALPGKSGSFQKQHFLINNIKSMVVPPSYHIFHTFEALHPKPQTLNPQTSTLNPNTKSSSGEALPSKSGSFQKQHFLINNIKSMVVPPNYHIFHTFEAKPYTRNPKP